MMCIINTQFLSTVIATYNQFLLAIQIICLSIQNEKMYKLYHLIPFKQEAQLKQGLANRTAKTAVSVAI